MFLGFPDPDPLVGGMDPDPSIIPLSSSKNSKKNLVTSMLKQANRYCTYHNVADIRPFKTSGSGFVASGVEGPGCLYPGCKFFPSRIHIKEFKYF
jgi:hypothetical protein